MKVKEFINELKYYQMFLGEVISAHYINEAICDFAEGNFSSFAKYGNCLGQVSSNLLRSQHILCDILLRKNKESKSIPRTIDRIFNEPFGNDNELKEKIQSILNKVKDDLASIEQDVENLGEFRNNVYAHFNNNLFSEKWQVEYKLKYPFDYEKMVDICKKCVDNFSEVLILLGEKPYLKAIIRLGDVNFLIDKLSQ